MVMANRMQTSKPFLVSPQRATIPLKRVPQMGTAELRTLYRDLLGSDIPAGNSELARRKIAWHIQAEKEGGLPESVRQHALGVARESALRVRLGENLDRRRQGLPLRNAVTSRVVSDHDSRLPMPGSLLVKQYRGRTIVVRVLTSGFEYDGRKLSSLSAVAKEITGTKWNGFSFFGLAKEGVGGR
jgi:hypothetical protein